MSKVSYDSTAPTTPSMSLSSSPSSSWRSPGPRIASHQQNVTSNEGGVGGGGGEVTGGGEGGKRDVNSCRQAVSNLSFTHGSLDGNNPDGSKKLHLSEYGADCSSDSLDRKTLKDTSIMSSSASKLAKRESLKEKKKNYRSQKKEVAREIMNSASDQSFVLKADWLKVRGTLKGWTKLWCACKPGMLILYKSEKMKTGHWVGTILLSSCQILQRPSKKEGFCFKLFHPMDQSIWATKGPKGETIGAIVQPLPVSYLIFRAPSENQGKCWMDALELALRCTSLIKRTTSRPQDISTALHPDLSDLSVPLTSPDSLQSTTADDTEDGVEELEEAVEEHYSEDDDHSSIDSGSDFELAEEYNKPGVIPRVEETLYIPDCGEELGQQGDACQTEEVNEENKSLIWTLVKQVRPGMDLSKVVLPTFILEPRSFLDKLTDYYYHADLLSQAVQQETALERMKHVVKWYLSGFYKKPKGLKKPYNPIIGETFRCYWTHPDTKSRTFYVAEQISHHPPVSAFHVTNRHDGFNINGCILAKSKFYGNSISAILEGVATLTFLERGEDYFITMPYAHCKGILLGTLTMEMGGKVTLNCPKTGYHCDLDFKLKPFFGNGESANRITGRIRMGSEVLCTFEGHWDQQIYIKEITNRERVVFWDPSPDVRAKRLVRHVVPQDKQMDNESQRLWRKVSEAVMLSDMHSATAEKHFLEEKQRSEAKERHKTKAEWIPKWFNLDTTQNKWIYNHVDGRPWDPMTDCVQYEKDYVISTQTVHTVPRMCKDETSGGMVHTRHIKGYNSSQLDSDSSDANVAEISDDSFKGRNTNRAPTSSEGVTISELTKETHQQLQHQLLGQRQQHKFSRFPSDSSAKMKQDGHDPEGNVFVHRKLMFNPEHHGAFSKSCSVNGHSNGKGVVGPESGQGHHRQNSLEVNGDGSLVKMIHSTNSTPMKTQRREVVLDNNMGGPIHSNVGQASPSNSGLCRDSPSSSLPLSKEFQTIVKMAEAQQEIKASVDELLECVKDLKTCQSDSGRSGQAHQYQHQHSSSQGGREREVGLVFSREWILIAVVLVFQMLVQCYLSR